jgi:predicted  nucleic acid-binding Zn-ribbon protein
VHFFSALTGGEIVKDQLHLLWRLQTVERQIEESQREMASYPVELEKLRQSREARGEKEEEEKKGIEGLERERVRMEGELEMERERIKRSQLKLLEIKNNKEYQALLHEIEGGTERTSQREEEIIVLLEKIDQTKANYVNTVEQGRQENIQAEEETTKVKNMLAATEQDIVRNHHTREEIVRELDPELLKRYNTLKEKRNGIAVVLVKNEGCQGCYVNIPPQMYNEVQKHKEIIVCPNCNRILYWEDTRTV